MSVSVLRRPKALKDVRDDAYTHGYVDALTHLATTLHLASVIQPDVERAQGVRFAAHLTAREAKDLLQSRLVLNEPSWSSTRSEVS